MSISHIICVIVAATIGGVGAAIIHANIGFWYGAIWLLLCSVGGGIVAVSFLVKVR